MLKSIERTKQLLLLYLINNLLTHEKIFVIDGEYEQLFIQITQSIKY